MDSSASTSENPESENPDPVPGTYEQQVQLQPVVRPEKSGTSAEFTSRQGPLLFTRGLNCDSVTVTLSSMCISESDLETEPTEPGPLGKKAPEMRTNQKTSFTASKCLIFRLQRGTVPLHQTLLCSQAVQTVPQQPLLLQVNAKITSRSTIHTHTASCTPAQSFMNVFGQTNSLDRA